MTNQTTNKMEKIYESTADTAKKIRAALKVTFPKTKFSVRSHGGSVNVSWVDMPLRSEVEEITNKFSSTSFDGMEDMATTHGYIMDGKHFVGADYIFANRELSDEYKATLTAFADDFFGDMEKYDYGYNFVDLMKAEKYMMEQATKQTEIIEHTEIQEQPITESTITASVQDSGITYQTGTGVKGNGIEITFTSKPSEEVRNMIKANGYRWGGNKRPNIWWAIMSDETISLAAQLAGNTIESDITEVEYNSQLTKEQQETLSARLQKDHVKPLRLFKHNNSDSILFESENLNITEDVRKPFYFIISNGGTEHGKGYDFEHLNEYTLIHTFNESEESITATVQYSYPDIEIDDCFDEIYNIPQSLQDRENDNSLFRNSKRDHTKELQELFTHYTEQVKDVLSITDNEYYIYKLKQSLQRFKKNYHTAYIKYITHKSNNPSWVITGRGNLNVSKYNKGMDRQDKLMLEVAELPEMMKSEISKYKNKIRKDKETALKEQLKQELSQPLPELTFKTITKEFDLYGNGVQIKTRFYECEGYSICKAWGAFRIYDTATGKELHSTKSNGTLKDAKAYVQLQIKHQRQAS